MPTWAKGLIIAVFVLMILGIVGGALLTRQLTGPPHTHSYVVTVMSNVTRLEENQNATITVIFMDNSVPLSGATVSLAASPATVGAIIGSQVGTTDTNGRATFSYRAAIATANTTVTLTAAATNDTTTTTGTVTVTVVAPQPNYAAELTRDSLDSALEYQGRTPQRTYFLLVNVTLNNTGDTAFTIGRTDIWLANMDGIWIAYPDAYFYTDVNVASGSSATLVLVFDLPSYANPAKITLSLPDGSRVSAWL